MADTTYVIDEFTRGELKRMRDEVARLTLQVAQLLARPWPSRQPPAPPRIMPVQFVSARGGGGYYEGHLGSWKSKSQDTGTDFDASDATNFEGEIEITIRNIAESTLGTNRVGADTPFFAWPTDQADTDGHRIWETIYSHAVRFVRQNPTTQDLEYTTHDAADAASVPSGDWIVFATASICDTTPTATLMQLMNPGSYQ
jgi:hypothetical protein